MALSNAVCLVVLFWRESKYIKYSQWICFWYNRWMSSNCQQISKEAEPTYSYNENRVMSQINLVCFEHCTVTLWVWVWSALCTHSFAVVSAQKTKPKCNLNLFPYSVISALIQHLLYVFPETWDWSFLLDGPGQIKWPGPAASSWWECTYEPTGPWFLQTRGQCQLRLLLNHLTNYLEPNICCENWRLLVDCCSSLRQCTYSTTQRNVFFFFLIKWVGRCNCVRGSKLRLNNRVELMHIE